MSNSSKPTNEQPVAKIKNIQVCLRERLEDLHQKLDFLYLDEGWESNLADHKKNVETRAIDLEAEVKQLREELRDIKDFLRSNLKERNSGDF